MKIRHSWYALLHFWGLISDARRLEIEREYAKSWRLSGFTTENADAGVIDIGCMPRTKALKMCAKLNPRSVVIHVDDENKIVTYRLTK